MSQEGAEGKRCTTPSVRVQLFLSFILMSEHVLAGYLEYPSQFISDS